MSIELENKKYLMIGLAFLFVGLGFLLYEGSAPEKSFEIKKVSESSEFYEINAEYPAGDKVGVNKARELVMNNISEFKNIANRVGQEARNRGITAPFSFDMSLDIYESGNFISYVFYVSEYTGGANVNNVVFSLNYDKQTGNEVTLSDVLSSERQDSFEEKVKQNLMQKSDEAGVFPDIVKGLDLSAFDVFYITDETITILFSKYVVAPGAAGIVEVTIPRK